MKNIILVFLGVLVLTSCDSSDKTSKTPEQIQAEVEASQKKFAEEMKRIELENKARLEKVAHQRSYVKAKFISVDEVKVTVELSNNTDRNIDNISGSLNIIDQNGDHVAGVGLTYWVTGQIYLPVGKTVQAQKSLELMSASVRAKIISEAKSYNYYFTTARLQYESGAEINLELSVVSTDDLPAGNTEKPVVKTQPNTDIDTNKPPKLPSEPCGLNQITVTVTVSEQYYPGPKCSHIGRHLDSERFKQKNILLCQEKTQATSPPPSAARVQITACGPAQGRKGIIYTNRICCDIPKVSHK